MGVHGLWQLISSTGKPVPLESLEGKVLAVDVSVWLHQLSKGMRDGSGNPVPNAHLHGLFTRICKLLHCRIKPVFVFDGGVPTLKKQTLANRKSRRDDAEKSSELMQQKILTNLIRSQVLQAAAGDASGPIGPYYTKPKSKSDKDTLFELPPIPETSKRYLNENIHKEEAFIERRELQAMIEEEYEDLNEINVESEDFKSLPAEIQHEIIYDIQQNRKNYNMSKIAELPSNSNDFSSYQMSKLLKHSKLHSRLEEVRKEINTRQTQDLSKYYSNDLYGADVQSQRLVSDETSHILLIKGLKNKQKNPEQEERKKRLEMEKRRKNRKLLEKVFPGLSEDSNYTDELLQDSENEDLKDLDFLKVEQKALSDKIITENMAEDSKEKGNNDLAMKEVVKDNRGDKIPTVNVKSMHNDVPSDKPRFRPEIEIETDSSEEDVEEELSRISKKSSAAGFTADDTNTIVIDDEVVDSEDEEMQLAIALSLQQDKNGADAVNVIKSDYSNSTEIDGQIEIATSDDKCKKITAINGTTDKSKHHHDNRNENTNKHEKRKNTLVSFEVKDGKFPTKIVVNKSKTSHIEEQKPLIQTKRQSLRLKAQPKSQSGACIFKRQISNLSNEDIVDEPVPRKVITTESENSDKDMDKEQSNGEDVSDVESRSAIEVSEESDNDFIEVTIDPSKVHGDDLFPSSMFKTVKENGEEDSLITKQQKSTENSGDESEENTSIVSQTDFEDYEVTARTSEVLQDTKEDNDDEVEISVLQGFDKTPIKMQKLNDVEGMEKSISNKNDHKSNLDNEQDENKEILGMDVKNVTNDRVESRSPRNTDEPNTTSVDDDDNTNVNLSQVSQISEVSQVSVTSTESQVVLENGEEVKDGVFSPKVSDLVKEYQAMDEIIAADSSWRLTLKNLGNTQVQWNIHGMRDGLAKEEKQLLKERGRQERLAMSITDQMHTEAQELLQLFGIPYVISPTEAEAQCAQLDYSKQTQGTITDDSDIWLFGGTCVYKNFFNQQKYVECFRMDSIEGKLGLTRQALINIALLCGSDYTDGIQGVGPVTAMEILAEFPGEGLEGLTKFRDWWGKAQTDLKVRSETKLRAKLRELEIKEGFPHPNVVEAYLNPVVDSSSEKFTWGTPDLELLRQFAVDKLGWNKVKVDETLNPVLKRMKDKQGQMRISAYFQPEIYMQPAKMKSKRLQNVVNKFLNPDADGETTNAEKDDIDIAKVKGESKRQKGGKKKAAKQTNDVQQNENLQEENLHTMDKTQDPVVQEHVDDKSSDDCSTARKDIAQPDAAQGRKSVKGKSVIKTRKNLRTKSKNVKYAEESGFSSDADSMDSSVDSDSDDNIVEASLDVSEILGLKIGPSLIQNDDSVIDKIMGTNWMQSDEDVKDKVEMPSTSQRVFVSGLNVDEIMKLDTGASESLELKDEENVLEKWDCNLKDTIDPCMSAEESQVEKEHEFAKELKDTPVEKEVDYSNEGGFLREKSDDGNEELDTKPENEIGSEKGQNSAVRCSHNKSMKRKYDNIDDIPNEVVKKNKSKTRSTIGYKSDSVSVKKTDENADRVLRKTRQSVKMKDKRDDVINIEHKFEDTEAVHEDSENSKVKKHDNNFDCDKSELNYTANPIKKLLTGVPWEKRAAKRGRTTKGSVKGKLLQVEPKEKLSKKKEALKVPRKAIGVVNLSESSSDSD